MVDLGRQPGATGLECLADLQQSDANASSGPAGPKRKTERRTMRRGFRSQPVSIVQFYGDGGRDIDVDLKVKQGTFLSHWPMSNERGGRLQWFKSDLSKTPPAQIPPSYLPENHWFQKLRDD